MSKQCHNESQHLLLCAAGGGCFAGASLWHWTCLCCKVCCGHNRKKKKKKKKGGIEGKGMEGKRQKQEGRLTEGGRMEREEKRGGTAREMESEGAMLQCSGCFPRAVLLLVNKQNTGLS